MAYVHRTKEGVPYITSMTLAGWSSQVHHDFIKPLIDRGFLGLNGGAWIIREKHRGQTARVVCMTQEAGMILLQSKQPKTRKILIEKMRQAFEAEAERYQRKAANPPGKRRYGLVDMAQPEPMAAQVSDMDRAAEKVRVAVEAVESAMAGAEVETEMDWRAIIRAAGIESMPRELAANCKLIHLDESLCALHLPKQHEPLLTRRLVDSIQESLRNYFRRPLVVAVEVVDDQPAIDPATVPNRDLVHVVNWETRTTSLVVAKFFGKSHAHVLRDIQSLECSPEFRQSNFGSAEYKDFQGKPRPMFTMTRDGFTFLAMGFTGKEAAKWKERYIQAFNAMEAELKRRDQKPPKAEHDQISIPDLVGALEAAAKFNLAYIGMPKEQAVIGANHLVKNKHGVDYLALVQAGGMRATTQDVLITPTLIGKSLARNAQQVNELLCRVGLQVRFYDEKKNSRYQLTEQGAVFGEYVVECPPNKIEPVRYIKWRPSVIDFLESKINGEVA